MRNRTVTSRCLSLWLVVSGSWGLLGCDDDAELAPLQPSRGVTSVLDSGGLDGDTGWWPSLAIDNSGGKHLSYCDAHHGDLKYAFRNPQGWRVESVVTRGAVGKYTAIAADSSGAVGLAFYDQDRKYLRYAWRPKTDAPLGTEVEKGENGWVSEKVAWGLEVGMAAELRFDAKDDPHLFYYIPSGKLIHAHRRDGEWLKAPLMEATGSFSVRIDPVLRDDGFWVSFVHWTFKDTTLYLARPKGESFELEVVDTEKGPGWRSQLLFNGDEPVVLYSRTRKPQLRMARKGPEGWASTLLVPEVANFAARITTDGVVVAAYEDTYRSAAGKGIVRYLRYPLRSAQPEVQRFDLDPAAPTGAYLAMQLHQGKATIAYYSGEIRGLKVFEEGI